MEGPDVRLDPQQRLARRAAAQNSLPRVAAGPARDGSRHGPVRRRQSRGHERRRTRRIRNAARPAGPADPRLDHGRRADARGIRHRVLCARRGGAASRARAGDALAMNVVDKPQTPAAAAARRLAEGGVVTLARAPEGFDAFVVADLARALAGAGEKRAVALVFVARDGVRAQSFIDALGFAAPEVEALYLPSWDCQPYDRVSPNAAISAERMTVLARLAKSRGSLQRPRILVASVSALTQRTPPRSYMEQAALSAAPGNTMRMEDIVGWCEANGYQRASTVRDVGDYA